MEWHDIIGTAGAAMILVSYFLLQMERLSGTDLAYSVINSIGAALILISLSVEFNLSAFIVEAFWLAISLLGVVRYFHSKDIAKDDQAA